MINRKDVSTLSFTVVIVCVIIVLPIKEGGPVDFVPLIIGAIASLVILIVHK